jgi:hypothetical protein
VSLSRASFRLIPRDLRKYYSTQLHLSFLEWKWKNLLHIHNRETWKRLVWKDGKISGRDYGKLDAKSLSGITLFLHILILMWSMEIWNFSSSAFGSSEEKLKNLCEVENSTDIFQIHCLTRRDFTVESDDKLSWSHSPTHWKPVDRDSHAQNQKNAKLPFLAQWCFANVFYRRPRIEAFEFVENLGSEVWWNHASSCRFRPSPIHIVSIIRLFSKH